MTLPIAKLKTEGLGIKTLPSMLVPLARGARRMWKEVMAKPEREDMPR